jgi:hypothetical protein
VGSNLLRCSSTAPIRQGTRACFEASRRSSGASGTGLRSTPPGNEFKLSTHSPWAHTLGERGVESRCDRFDRPPASDRSSTTFSGRRDEKAGEMRIRGSVIGILGGAVLLVGAPGALGHQASPKRGSGCSEAQWRAGAHVREGKITLTCSLKKGRRHYYFWTAMT